jgi:twinfilin-like protein
MSEEERAEVKKNEVNSEIGVGTRHQTLQGLMFPLTTKALDALKKFQSKNLNYVQLKIGKLERQLELHCISKYV